MYLCCELSILPRSKGLKLMKIAGSKLNQGLDGVADIVCIHEGDSVKIHSDKRKLLIPATEIIERISSLERIGETLPTEVQGVNFIEVIPAPPASVAAPAPESADSAQDTPRHR